MWREMSNNYLLSRQLHIKKSFICKKRLQTKAKLQPNYKLQKITKAKLQPTDYTAKNEKLFIFANFVRTNNVNEV